MRLLLLIGVSLVCLLLVGLLMASANNPAIASSLATMNKANFKVDTVIKAIQPQPIKYYVFLSLSMPQNSLQAWTAQANKNHIPVVLRGFVENDLKKTLNRIQAINPKHPPKIEINPLLFKRFNIHQAPAVVRVYQHQITQLYGDTDLAYALAQLEKKSLDSKPHD